MTEDAAHIGPAIAALEKRLELETAQVAKTKNAIQALQEICEHHWEYQGHSHNDDYYICSICKKDKWQ